MTKYVVVVHQEAEGGSWAEVPGEIIEELKDNLREAISGVVEVLKEHGGTPESNIQIIDLAV